MLTKTLFTATFFALASFTVATPPGCLLGTVNSYDNPADIKAVCSAKGASQTIQKYCGDSTKQALEAFADVCNGVGVKVSTDVPTSSGSASASASASGSKASATVSGSMTIQASGSGSANAATATGGPRASGTGGAAGASGTSTGGSAQSTGAAGRLEVGVAALVAGFLAAAL